MFFFVWTVNFAPCAVVNSIEIVIFSHGTQSIPVYFLYQILANQLEGSEHGGSEHAGREADHAAD